MTYAQLYVHIILCTSDGLQKSFKKKNFNLLTQNEYIKIIVNRKLSTVVMDFTSLRRNISSNPTRDI